MDATLLSVVGFVEAVQLPDLSIIKELDMIVVSLEGSWSLLRWTTEAFQGH